MLRLIGTKCLISLVRIEPRFLGTANFARSVTKRLLRESHWDLAELVAKHAIISLVQSNRWEVLGGQRASREAPYDDESSKRHQELFREALSDFLTGLRRQNVEPFLTFGTLLGAIREGQFIHGDKDIDLGVVGDMELEKASKCLADSALFEIERCYRQGQFVLLKAIHRNGSRIDLKLFLHDGKYLTWISDKKLGLERRYKCSFRFEKMDFLGIQVSTPSDPHRFLEQHYGNWRVPDLNYDMYVTGPIGSENHRRWLKAKGPYTVLKFANSGNLQKTLALAERMLDHFPQDQAWANIVEQLHRFASDSPAANRPHLGEFSVNQ